MALNFPDSPTLNQVYTDATSGFSYLWNGSVWISYESSTASNIQELDDISGSFDGITDTFPLTVGSQSITPANTNQLIISVGGVMQNPTNDFYISGSNIVFTTPPTSGLTFFGTLLGTALSLNTIADGTVTGGSLRISTKAVVGAATTFIEDLVVNGNARVVGVLTVGTSSIIFDGTNNEIKIGTGVTISSTGITGSASTVTSASVAYGLDGSPNIIVGIATVGTTLNVTGQSTLVEIKETVYTLGTTESIALNPANGSIQSSVLTGNPTFTDSLEAGQTIVLMLENGASYTVTWPTITWVTSAGNAAPTLTAKDTLVLWKVSTTLYGAYVGSYV